jgi:hypothetical protein
MASVGVTLNWDLQCRIAEANGIVDFSGTYDQNVSMLDDHFCDAFSDSVEADYLQEEMDGVLREIFGDELIPFAERYPIVKQYGYLKARKGWK